MNVLIIKTNKDALHDYEFVTPVITIIKQIIKHNQELLGTVNHRTKHYSGINSKIKNGDIDWADKVIITGTALMDYEYLNNDSLMRMKNILKRIDKLNKPVLGICSGMHLIAGYYMRYYTTETYNNMLINASEIGVEEIVVKEEILGLKPGTTRVFQLHNKSLNYDLIKDDFDVLAITEHNNNTKHEKNDIHSKYDNINNIIIPQIIRSRENKSVVGVQFHPEVLNKELILKFLLTYNHI
ncbi:hypothetical protein B6U93_04215 [Candidatus Woesearchaeota archaeon ex4484_78]|nr:MAG: hypothetical protein B6U93_04215 [Candidatus Woesearchaeota archaeon ex4484_78]